MKSTISAVLVATAVLSGVAFAQTSPVTPPATLGTPEPQAEPQERQIREVRQVRQAVPRQAPREPQQREPRAQVSASVSPPLQPQLPD
jgi:hypothetical protein